ncbi:MAG: hypothetical protein U1B83_09195, partial [Candidatus Cloacimonadaceae bacterium]|nr:hypothetical protein [Candidatus Cloacimonadaceae bacterium]
AMRGGLSFSGTEYDYIELENETLGYVAALISISYFGLGFLASKGRTDYGEFSITSEDTFEGYTIHARDKNRIYGFSVDLQEFYSRKRQGKAITERFDLAFGLNLIRNSSNINAEGTETFANSANLGLLVKVLLLQSNAQRLEAAAGATLFNVFNQGREPSYTGEEERIYKRLNLAGGLSATLLNPRFNDGSLPGMFSELASLRLMAGASNEFASDPLILGFGGELGLVDLLFLRTGYHHDDAGNIKGLTYGAGLNLHFRKLINLRYDYAHFPAATGFSAREISSYGINIDILGWINGGKKPPLH